MGDERNQIKKDCLLRAVSPDTLEIPVLLANLEIALELAFFRKQESNIVVEELSHIKENTLAFHESLLFTMHHKEAPCKKFFGRVERSGAMGVADVRVGEKTTLTKEEIIKRCASSAGGLLMAKWNDVDPGLVNAQTSANLPPAEIQFTFSPSSTSNSDKLRSIIGGKDADGNQARAKDVVRISWNIEDLLVGVERHKIGGVGTDVQYEWPQTLKFNNPVPVDQLLRLAIIVHNGSPEYDLFSTNCYFFSSMIFDLAEILWSGTKSKSPSVGNLGTALFGCVKVIFLLSEAFEAKKVKLEEEYSDWMKEPSKHESCA